MNRFEEPEQVAVSITSCRNPNDTYLGVHLVHKPDEGKLYILAAYKPDSTML